MASRPISTSRLDRVAMGLSGLCAVHCVATAILLGLLASAGGLLGNPIIHEVGLTLAMILGAAALGQGIREHERVCAEAKGWVETQGWTVFGVTPSPITGPEGNVEFLLGAMKNG